jgi:hypothetical protein
LNELEEAIKASPDSPTAQIIKKRITRQEKHYSKCKDKNKITESQLSLLRNKKSKLSDY